MPKHPETTPEEAKLRLASALLSLRLTRSMTQEQLAHESGIHVTSLRDYEQGRTAPSWPTLIRIAKGLDISMAAIGHAYDQAPPHRPTPKIGRPRKTPPPRT